MTTTKFYSYLIKFTVKSCKFINVFLEFFYKQSLSKRNFKYSLMYSFLYLMNCKHSFKNAIRTNYLRTSPIWEVMSYIFWNTSLTNFNLFFIRLLGRRKIIQIIINMPNYLFINVFKFFLNHLRIIIVIFLESTIQANYC